MNQLRFIRETIYSLKREYGVPADLYTIVATTTDLETGTRESDKRVFRIKRAILLPKRLYTDVITLVGGGQALHHGALTDKSERVVIIDAKDYPKDYTPKPEDYVVINTTRFNVVEATDFDHKLAVILRVKQIEGELPRQILEVGASSAVRLNSGGGGET